MFGFGLPENLSATQNNDARSAANNYGAVISGGQRQGVPWWAVAVAAVAVAFYLLRK